MAEQHLDSRPECTYCLSAGHGALTCEFMDGDSSIICVFKYKWSLPRCTYCLLTWLGCWLPVVILSLRSPKPLKSLELLLQWESERVVIEKVCLMVFLVRILEKKLTVFCGDFHWIPLLFKVDLARTGLWGWNRGRVFHWVLGCQNLSQRKLSLYCFLGWSQVSG